MAVISEDGIKIRTLEEIVGDNTKLWSLKTGDFDVAPSSAGGELIAIKSEFDARFEQDIANAFLNTTIQASGENLDLVAERKGIEKRFNKPTISVVTFKGANGTIIPRSTEMECSINSERFITQYQATIENGEVQISAQSINFDNVICPAETLSLVSPIVGVDSATNTTAGIVGFVIESDQSLRQRIELVGTETSHIKDGLYLSLIDLAGVGKARVIDNNTDLVMEGVVPPRFFATIVYGGNTEEVAQTVFNFMQNGNPSYGEIQSKATSLRGQVYNVFFTRAEELPVEIDITYTKNDLFDDFNSEGIMIENVVNLVNSLKIGETLFLQKVESVALVQGVTSVSVTINSGGTLTANWKQIIVTNPTKVSVHI